MIMYQCLKIYQLQHFCLFYSIQVRALFENLGEASEIGRSILEGLTDGNYLKPVMWAEHKEKHDCYAVSLGVRPFLRPLYLYIKMNELRNVKNWGDDVKLEDVEAFRSMYRTNMRESNKSKYKKRKLKVIPPCVSCKIFFGGFNEKLNGSFNPFANCAEYDVIPRDLQGYIEKINDWEDFKSACQEHFEAFNELTRMLNTPGNPSQNEIMETYFANTRNAKVLKYQWNHSTLAYELVAEDWSPVD